MSKSELIGEKKKIRNQTIFIGSELSLMGLFSNRQIPEQSQKLNRIRNNSQ